MAERLLGVETEYAISAMQGREAAARVPVIRRLMELAHATLPNVRDGSSCGLFMENGGRLYLDCGMHVEFSTPECVNPWDAVRYVEAGHQTMLKPIERFLPSALRGSRPLAIASTWTTAATAPRGDAMSLISIA